VCPEIVNSQGCNLKNAFVILSFSLDSEWEPKRQSQMNITAQIFFFKVNSKFGVWMDLSNLGETSANPARQHITKTNDFSMCVNKSFFVVYMRPMTLHFEALH